MAELSLWAGPAELVDIRRFVEETGHKLGLDEPTMPGEGASRSRSGRWVIVWKWLFAIGERPLIQDRSLSPMWKPPWRKDLWAESACSSCAR